MLAVEAQEVFAVVRDDSAPLCSGKGEHFVIGNAAAGIPCVPRREHVVSEHAQMLYDAERIVLV